MKETLESPTERKNFWAYNNGLTFICDKIATGRDKSITLKNFSIVNGCQTTVSLSNEPTSKLKDVRVLVRIIESSEKAIDPIIRFNNSQSPNRLWDLNSQDKFQKKLKKEIESLPQPFLYVLRKGETPRSAAEKAKFKRDGKLNQIPHDVCAQYLAAFRGLPAIGYKDKGKVFSAPLKDEIFPPQLRAEELVLSWQLSRVVREQVKLELQESIANEDPKRIAILKRGSAFFIVAIAATLLHERNGGTFLNRLKPETATSKATFERLQNYASISLEWYVQIISELVSAGDEISTIVRSQASWQKIRSKALSNWKIYKLSKKAMEEALPRL